MEFILSKMDPRELPKGTRDPLGFEIIWTTTGRKIIGNLTTITRSIEEFATALLGFDLCVKGKSESDDRDRFIRYEQVAAYLRYKAKRKSIRGQNKVSERANKDIQISTLKEDQILSNQSAYGLWGLYSMVLESTKLTKQREVTHEGKKILDKNRPENLIPFFEKFINSSERQVLSRDEVTKRAPDFTTFLQNRELKMKLLSVLLKGVEKYPLQRELFKALESLKPKGRIWDLADSLKNQGGELGKTMENIIKLNRVLTVANAIFNYLRQPENANKELNEIIALIDSKIGQPLDLDTGLSDFVDRGFSEELKGFVQNTLTIINE